jgi:putative Mg2+ transporter-C (MgtC) family protein
MSTFLDIIDYLREVNLISIAVRIAFAFLVGGIVGFERGKKGRAAGFRTHILVCVGSCLATLTGQYIISVLEMSGDPARLGAQVISGIGFLGAGTIITTGKNHVRGLTTAAGLWSTAAIGLAIGIGFYEAAIVGSIAIVFTIVILHKFDYFIFAKTADIDVYIEIDDIGNLKNILNSIKELEYDMHNINITPPKSGVGLHVGIEGIISSKKKWNKSEVITLIGTVPGIVFITETT